MRSLTPVHLSFILCGVFLAGCQSSKTAHSGFLGDYSGFRASSEYKGAMEYKHPSLTLADYDKFMIDPIIVHFAPNVNPPVTRNYESGFKEDFWTPRRPAD